MGNFVDLTGKRFDRLVVLERAGIATNGDALWLCRCVNLDTIGQMKK